MLEILFFLKLYPKIFYKFPTASTEGENIAPLSDYEDTGENI